MLLAIPALRAARRRWPQDTLILAAQPRIGRLLVALGVVDRAVDFEALGLDALFEIEPAGAELGWPARCADDLRRATRVIAWIGSREPRFVRRLTSLVPGAVVAPSVGAGRPVWEHLLDTVGATGWDRALCEPVVVQPAVVDEARGALVDQGWDGRVPLLVIHPGAGGRGKRFAPAGFSAVIEGVAAALPQLAIVVHQGPADADAVASLSGRLAGRVVVLQEPELPLLAGVLSHATAYLGNDSGVSHLAAAVGARSVVLFGADRMVWRPWASHAAPLVVAMPILDEPDVARVEGALTRLLS